MSAPTGKTKTAKGGTGGRAKPAKSVGLISLGCSKNLADSEVMAGHLLKAGFTLAPSPDRADVILVNTCAFIEPARAEAAENILAACAHKRNGKCRLVVVSGCLPQRYREAAAEAFPDVDAFLGVDELDRLPDIIREAEARSDRTHPVPLDIAEGLPTRVFSKPIEALRLSGPVSAYVKIGEGCDHACAFCAIPKIRGRLRSRPSESILSEARELLRTGTREINLVAQDVTAYGRDLRGGNSLASLLRQLDALEGDFWIRFLYGFHNRVTDELLEVVANSRHILPYFDLPIQHSDPEVLRAMRRADTIKAIDTFPERLRALPGATLRTTCMVGFPGETEEAFEGLLAYIERVRFDHLGAFIFSPEEGTAAAEMDGLPPPDVAQARHARLMETQKRIAREVNRARVGTVGRALVTDWYGEDGLTVRMAHQAPEVDGVTHILHAPEDIRPGDFVTVRVTGCRGYDLTAKLV